MKTSTETLNNEERKNGESSHLILKDLKKVKTRVFNSYFNKNMLKNNCKNYLKIIVKITY